MVRQIACAPPIAAAALLLLLCLVGALSLAPRCTVPSLARADTLSDFSADEALIDEDNSAMSRMMAGMAVTPTGNIDRDFVAMMVPHHQGAIDMAQAELRNGHNQQLLRVSEEIIALQLQEIAAMQLAIGTAGAARSPSANAHQASVAAEKPFLQANDAAMHRMMADMSIEPSGDADRDFVAMMVPHHQGAVDMTKAELRYGRSAVLRRISQEIIVDQTQEIVTMRLAFGEALPPEMPLPTDPSHRQP